ncbi:MAG: bifunctional 2',3'-cyclic-nucleotide 2'-phosphodiesterase/3'-nucleotidase [Pseudomonadota bacterium]
MNWPFEQSPAEEADTGGSGTSPRHIWLRLLATTDIHAHLLPYDYNQNREVTDFGLARTATLIEAARAEAPQSVLFDNGDFLQGTPLSDVPPLETNARHTHHPVIEAMNSLDYAVVGLGNHEFNFGLSWLDHVLEQAHFPVVCANLVYELDPDDPARDKTVRPPFVLLDVNVRNSRGDNENLKLGVIGFIPPQVTTWDHTHLHGRVKTRDIVEAAQAHVPVMRAKGSDIVVALAHTGIKPGVPRAGMENAAAALSRVEGIDAIIAGHTHEVFPDPQLTDRRDLGETDIDHARGTLGGVPAVMAGYRGSHLGVLDLHLHKTTGGWHVGAHKAQARPVHPSGARAAPAVPSLIRLAEPAHLAALDRNAVTLGHSDQPMHSYLAQIRACPALVPVLAAQREALSNFLSQHAGAPLPVLSATPPFRTGGHAGPRAYTDIPAGPLEMRHLDDLYPFPNTLIGLKLSGADILDWLERAASCFCQLTPRLRCQTLWDSAFAGHAFDTVSGVTYKIDLTRPARYDAEGQLRDAEACRITDLRLEGETLAHDRPVILATNSFRAFGGGPYQSTDTDRVIYSGAHQIKDLLADYLRKSNESPIGLVPSWSFLPVDGASVLLETGPGLRGYPDDMRRLGATDLGDTEDGFMRLDIPL